MKGWQKTKSEIQEAIDAVDIIFKSLSRPKKLDLMGELNTVFLVLEGVKREDRPEKGEKS